jgi:enoyl-CoA hydratase
VITGAGEKAFSAGADIAAMAAMSPADGHAYSRLGHDVLARLESLPVPVIAALNGVALGGGLELALACDLIVAAEKARLGQPEINLGLIPGFGGSQRLVRRIGQTRARELIYLGQALGAEEALRLGLVNRVFPAERLAEEASRLAAELASKAPLALAQAKRATAVAADADLETGCRYEVEAFGVTFASDDRVEGLTAFLAKRPPVWKGR